MDGVGQATAEQPGAGELQGQDRGEPLEDQVKKLPTLLATSSRFVPCWTCTCYGCVPNILCMPAVMMDRSHRKYMKEIFPSLS